MFIWLPTYKEWCLSLTAAVSACDFNSYSCNLSWVTSFICFPDHDCFFVGAAAWKLNPCCFGLERTRNNNSILFCLSTVVAAHNFNRFSCDSSWEQLFYCITDLESLSIHVQWTRLHARLVANGPVWSIVQGFYVLKQSEFDWYCQSYDFLLLQQQHNSSCL